MLNPLIIFPALILAFIGCYGFSPIGIYPHTIAMILCSGSGVLLGIYSVIEAYQHDS